MSGHEKNKTKREVQRTRREMREQEIKHEGTAREEKKWNKEKNERGQEVEHCGTTREEKKWNKERNERTRSGTWRNYKRGEEMEHREK